MTYSVVGCSTCSQLWIIDEDDPDRPVTAQCPRCETTHLRRKLKRFEKHGEYAGAAELRARKLANRAGHGDAYTHDVDDYAILADRADKYLAKQNGDLEDRVESYFENQEERYAELADAYLDHQEAFLADRAEEYLSDRARPYEDRANNYLNSIHGAGEEINKSTGDLTLTQQEPASAAATTTLADDPLADTIRPFLRTHAFQEALIEAARDVAHGETSSDYRDLLVDADVTLEGPGHVGSLVATFDRIARGDRRAAYQLDVLLSSIGSGRSPTDDLLAPARLLALSENVTPTVSVRLKSEFFDLRRERRKHFCDWLTVLSRGCDVRLVATGLQHRKLYEAHRGDVPVSRDDVTPQLSAPFSEQVREARDALDRDSREVAVLRRIAESPTETLSYSAVRSSFSVSRSRISQCLSTLTNLELVATFDAARSKHVELLAPGKMLLDVLDAEIEGVEDSEMSVSETGKSDQQAVYSRGRHDGSPSGGPYRTAYLSRPRHAALAACSVSGGFSTVTHPVDPQGSKVRGVSFNDDRDEVVVEWTATSAMQAVVSPALALASPEIVNSVLSDARLADLEEPPAILRDARCIGALSDEALENPETLRDGFLSWGEELEEMTTRLKAGEYEDRDNFRRDIMRSAHGLYGSLVHLLSALNIRIVRSTLVPPGLGERNLRGISQALAVSAVIQSQYGRAHAVYRQLFEPREEKRQNALSVTVDADDPYGELLGSQVLVGDDVHRLTPLLEAALNNPTSIHDDAPEFAVPIPIVERTSSREAYATTVRRLCNQKNMTATPDAVTLFQTFTGSPLDAASAIYGPPLAPEEKNPGRRIRVDEVRMALATVEADRLVPGETPTVQRALHALLRAEAPLNQTEIAERAGVSTRALRDGNLDRLEALGIVERTDEGWRLSLSFADGEERGDDRVLPWWFSGENTVHVVYKILFEALDEPERLSDPADPLGKSFYFLDDSPPDMDAAAAEVEWLKRWLPAIRTASAKRQDEFSDESVTADRVALVGARPSQASIHEFTAANGGVRDGAV